MRGNDLLLAVACTASTLFVCNPVEAVTMSPFVPSTMISTDAVRSTRLLRGYDMSDLSKDDSTNEERMFGAKLLDTINTKLHGVTKGTKRDEVITSWAKFPAIDDMMKNPAKITSAMDDAVMRDEMFTSWAQFPALSKNVVKALSKSPENKNVIDAFTKFKTEVDAAAKAKLSTRNIKKALNDADAQDKLFKSWNENKAVSDAIVTRLTEKFKKNEKILLAYNDYRTKLTYGETINGWLRMTDLKTVKGAINSDTKTVNKVFGGWYAEGQTAESLKVALGHRRDLKKEFKNVLNKYDDYLNGKKRLAEKIAEDKPRQDRLAHLAKLVRNENS